MRAASQLRAGSLPSVDEQVVHVHLVVEEAHADAHRDAVVLELDLGPCGVVVVERVVGEIRFAQLAND
jgi:hypothetical protein